MFIWCGRWRSRGWRFVFYVVPAVGCADCLGNLPLGGSIADSWRRKPCFAGSGRLRAVRWRIGELRAAAAAAGVEVLLGAISGFGRDASIAIEVQPDGPRRLFELPHPEHPRFEIAHIGGDRQLRSYPQSLVWLALGRVEKKLSQSSWQIGKD